MTKYDRDILDCRELGEELNNLKDLRDEENQGRGSFDGDDAARLRILQKLADDLNTDDLERFDEPTLIADSYFQTYAREMAEDCGDLDNKLAKQWPFRCIDWEKAAVELQQDYTSVEFDGETYWYRSC